MRFLEEHEIRQPRQSLIIEDHEVNGHPVDFILGEALGAPLSLGAYLQMIVGETMPVLYKNGDATPFIDGVNQLQRNNNFDQYCCVTHAKLGGICITHKAQGTPIVHPSFRYTGLKSGTIPNQGNSDSKVDQSIYKDGLVAEENCVSMTPTMTFNEYWAKLNPELDKYEYYKALFDTAFYKVPTYNGISSTRQDLGNIALYSVIFATVDGNYNFQNGLVYRTSQSDSHKVIVLKFSDGGQGFDIWLDSENPDGLVKADPHYDYHYCQFVYSKKKVMFRLAKTVSSPAVYMLCEASMIRLGVADSPEVEGLTGGELLKKFCGNYGNAGIQTISEEEMSRYNHAGDINANLF